MTKDRLIYLIQQFQAGQLNVQEEEELNAWFYSQHPGKQNMDNWLREKSRESLSSELYSEFSTLRKRPGRIYWIRRHYRAIAAIAAVLLIGILLIFYYNPSKQDKENLTTQNNATGQQGDSGITPGSNKATLVLADGSTITLSDSSNRMIAVQSSTTINQVNNGSIVYDVSAATGVPAGALIYNTLKTPRGGKYTLKLADGTIVTLDAASSITYPVAFTDPKERRVEITGQAYFDVVHNAQQPFRVLAKGQLTEDIGTAFNINAYGDEPVLEVTLIEGQAAVSSATDKVTLTPGQQARISDGRQNITVRKANIEEVVAWKDGWFIFHNESIYSIMKNAGRWYDVEIEYPETAITKKFGGNISRYKNITELLENLKLAGGINYKIEGRKVILNN